MSKSIPILLAAHYALAGTTLCTCLRIEPDNPDSDSWLPIGITTLDAPVTVDGLMYRPGLDITNLVSTAGLAVDNLDSSVLKINNILTDVDLLAGLLDGAKFTIFECNYMAPGDGVNIFKQGWIGQAQINQGIWTLEFRSKKQAYQQPIGELTSRTCRARLGDSRCRVDLTAFTFNGTVDDVTDQQNFADSSLLQDDEYFVNGTVHWLTGNNAGYRQKVKAYVGGTDGIGSFQLSVPMWFEIEIGDTFEVTAGCQLRHERTTANPTGVSDCLDKFNNVLNFQGEPHLPGVDGLTAFPDIPVDAA